MSFDTVKGKASVHPSPFQPRTGRECGPLSPKGPPNGINLLSHRLKRRLGAEVLRSRGLDLYRVACQTIDWRDYYNWIISLQISAFDIHKLSQFTEAKHAIIYVHIHIYMYMYVYKYPYIYKYMHVYKYTRTWTHVCIISKLSWSCWTWFVPNCSCEEAAIFWTLHRFT